MDDTYKNSIEYINIQEEFTIGKLDKSKFGIFSCIVKELSTQAIFVLDKNYFGILPDKYEYYTICPNYNGNEFTNYVILPSFMVGLIDMFPPIKEILAYRAYEISNNFPGKKKPQRLSWLYSIGRWKYPSQLPQNTIDEIVKLKNKLPKWLRDNNKKYQINTTILKSYLYLEKLHDHKVYKDELEKIAEANLLKIHQEGSFDRNFREMDKIKMNNNGKVFQVEKEEGRERVYLWCFAEEIIRKIEASDYKS